MRGQGENKGGLPLNTDNKNELRLARHVKVAFLLRKSGEADLLALLIAIFFDILLGALEDDSTLLLLGL